MQKGIDGGSNGGSTTMPKSIEGLDLGCRHSRNRSIFIHKLYEFYELAQHVEHSRCYRIF